MLQNLVALCITHMLTVQNPYLRLVPRAKLNPKTRLPWISKRKTILKRHLLAVPTVDLFHALRLPIHQTISAFVPLANIPCSHPTQAASRSIFPRQWLDEVVFPAVVPTQHAGAGH